jgi:colicin import membrane protein
VRPVRRRVEQQRREALAVPEQQRALRDLEVQAADALGEAQRELVALASVQAEDRSWMDKFYQEEFDKEWAKRQAQWDREAAARQALLEETTQGRRAQMADRARQGDAERARDAAQLAAFARGRAEAEAKEAAKAQKRADGLRNQAGYNRKQLEDNLAAREREKQEAYLEWRLQK